MKKLNRLLLLLLLINLNLINCNFNKRLNFKKYFENFDLHTSQFELGSSFVLNSYDVIGPFPSAPREDVDVLEAFGGINGIPRADTSTYPSELVFGGFTGWSKITSDDDGLVNIGYESTQVNWTLIEEWAGSSGSYFSGWALSDFTLDSLSNVILSCAGVSKFYIDNQVMQGDTYGSGIQYNSIDLSEGNHTVKVRFIGSEGAEFVCNIIINDLQTGPSIMFIYQDVLLPSIIENVGFASPYISFVILNLLNSSTTVNAQSLDDNFLLKYIPPANSNGVYFSELEVGQISPINFYIETVGHLNCTPGVVFGIPISVVGGDNFMIHQYLNFTCVEWGQPYEFTFIDFDGSVQYAATTPPLYPCPNDGCPVLITFHGADVEAKSNAWTGAYLRQNYTWTLFPTNRRNYGWDWQGPGMKNGIFALNTLANQLPGVPSNLKNQYGADQYTLQYAGHSMGGHGCWEFSTHLPDRAVSVSVAAGWIDMEIYTPFFLKLGYSWVDPFVKYILESAISEYNTDLYSPHLINLPLLVRMGSDDTNVPPFHLKRMNRLYGELRHNRTAGVVSEIPGEGHWFNGVVDDSFMQTFFNHYAQQGIPSLPNRFVVTCLNPATLESKGGISIEQLITPFRISKIQVQISSNQSWTLTSENVKRFGFVNTFPYSPKSINIDGQNFPYIQLPNHYCYNTTYIMKGKRRVKSSNNWSICNGNSWQLTERSKLNTGPLAQVIQNPTLIVYGTNGENSNDLRNLAVYLANNLYYQDRYAIPVVADYDVTVDDLSTYNVILFGGPSTNKLSQSLESSFPVEYETNNGYSFTIGSNTYSTPGIGLLFLSSCYNNNQINSTTNIRTGCMVAVIDGTDSYGLQQALYQFPTKSAAMVPDYLVTGPTIGYAGFGGLLSLGFWDNNWNYEYSLSYSTSILN